MNCDRVLRAVLFPLAMFAFLSAALQPRPVAAQDQQSSPEVLQIVTETQLPTAHLGVAYEQHLAAQGGVPALHWHVERGVLPPGIDLTDNGRLWGTPARSGEFQFTAMVVDDGSPHQTAMKQFVLHVASGLGLEWKTPARVNGSRIEGTVVVSNDSGDDLDLTFIVEAVAHDGRATAIGYQHFVLRKGTTGKELPFGETLPHGGYVVHVDAVGEVAPKNLIYHERMQTPGPLQVTVGP